MSDFDTAIRNIRELMDDHGSKAIPLPPGMKFTPFSVMSNLDLQHAIDSAHTHMRIVSDPGLREMWRTHLSALLEVQVGRASQSGSAP